MQVQKKLSLLLLLMVFSCTQQNPKWVEVSKIYDAFLLTKELKQKLSAFEKSKTQLYDSALVNNPKIALVQIEEVYQAELKKRVVEYDNQIWTQLNAYLKQFGEEKGYSMVLGANGNGTILYAKDADNVTNEAIAFVNDKFHGK